MSQQQDKLIQDLIDKLSRIQQGIEKTRAYLRELAQKEDEINKAKIEAILKVLQYIEAV